MTTTTIAPVVINANHEIEEFDFRNVASTAAVASMGGSGPDVPLSVGDQLATGSFGSVREATFRGESGWVVKVGKTDQRYVDEMINREIAVLRDMRGVRGFPVLRAVVRHDDTTQLVLQRLPHTLADLTHISPLPFEDVCRIAVQAIDAIEAMHDKGWVHRDIKPDNAMLDDRTGTLYLIDFGLAKRYVDEKNVHIPDLKTSKITGTPRYCSVPVHQGHTASRRDDLESLLYSLQYVLDGSLPWSGIKLKRDNNYVAHMRKKIEVGASVFAGPLLFLYQHVRELHFASRPNYAMLRDAFLSQVPGASSRTKLTHFRYLSRELEIGRPTRRQLDDVKAVARVAIRGLRCNPKLRTRVLGCMAESDRINWALLAHNDSEASNSLASVHEDGADDDEKKKKNPHDVMPVCYTVGLQNLVCDTSVIFRLKVPMPAGRGEVAYTFTNLARILWCILPETDDSVKVCAVNTLTGNHRYYRSLSVGPIAKIHPRNVFVACSGCLVWHSSHEMDLVTYDSMIPPVEIGSHALINTSNTCQVVRLKSDQPIHTPWRMSADGTAVVVCHWTRDTCTCLWQIFRITEETKDASMALKLRREFSVCYPDDPLHIAFSQPVDTVVVIFADHVMFHQHVEAGDHSPIVANRAVGFAGCRRALLWGNYWILFNATDMVFVDAKSLELYPQRIVFSDKIHDVCINNNESVLVGHDSTTHIVEGAEMVRTPTQQVQLWGNCIRLVIGAPRCLMLGHRQTDTSTRMVVSSLLIDMVAASSSSSKHSLCSNSNEEPSKEKRMRSSE